MDQPSPHLSCTKCAKCTTHWLPKSAKTATAQEKGEQWHSMALLLCLVSLSPQEKGRSGLNIHSSPKPTFVHRQLAILLALLYFILFYYDMPICHDMPSHGLICTAYIVKTYPGKWLICSFSHSFSHSITVSSAFGSLIMQCSLNSFFKTLFRTLSLSTREMPHKSPALLTSNSHPCSPLHNSLPLQHRDLVAHLQRPSHYRSLWTPNWSEDQAAVNLRQIYVHFLSFLIPFYHLQNINCTYCTSLWLIFSRTYAVILFLTYLTQ